MDFEQAMNYDGSEASPRNKSSLSFDRDVSNSEYKNESDRQIEYLKNKLNDLRVKYGHVSKSLDDQREKSKQLVKENLESAKITGSLSPKQKSTLTLSYPKNKKFKPLKKEVIEVYWMQKEEI